MTLSDWSSCIAYVDKFICWIQIRYCHLQRLRWLQKQWAVKYFDLSKGDRSQTDHYEHRKEIKQSAKVKSKGNGSRIVPNDTREIEALLPLNNGENKDNSERFSGFQGQWED